MTCVARVLPTAGHRARDVPRPEGAAGWLALRRAGIGRIVRYAATSVLAFGVSEVTLVVLYGHGLLGATAAALAANLAGTLPSYLLSRYWIWHDSPRRRVGRQIVLYWTVSAVTIATSSIATGLFAAAVPRSAPFHVAIVAAGFLVISVVLWLAKYVVYEHVVFPTRGEGEVKIEPAPVTGIEFHPAERPVPLPRS
jgi:putative flippase GtrA